MGQLFGAADGEADAALAGLAGELQVGRIGGVHAVQRRPGRDRLAELAQQVDAGAMVEVLQAYQPPPLPLSAVYPQNRHLSPRLRVFVDWLAEMCAALP